jgi:glucose-6-phosphate isomerase
MSALLPVGSADLQSRLQAHAKRLTALAPAVLFGAGRRGLRAEADGLLLDYSRQLIDAAALTDLVSLADAAGLHAAFAAQLGGATVNPTERRSALHTALRDPSTAPLLVDGADIRPAIARTRAACRAFVAAVHSGARRGATGEPFTDVINIGIGGSDLGPVMATEALAPYAVPQLRVHFASNIDGAALVDLTATLNPKTTLVVVCSKTFTTIETMTNAHRARAWVASAVGEGNTAAHFAAVSTNAAAMDAFGVPADARFDLWDWVGGRYSMWSAVGLAIELALGSEHFDALLSGAHAMDRHALEAPASANLPMLLALFAVWNGHFIGCHSHAVLPYAERLHRLPAYLQQLTMESNGKHVRLDGTAVDYPTGAVLWGEAGNNGQHSFFQLLHQGTHRVSADFVVPYESPSGIVNDSVLTLSNAFAQANVLARGRSLDDVLADPRVQAGGAAAAALAPHRVHPGGRPSSMLAFARLDPTTLGQIIALYEHRTTLEACCYGINPFDQWGVELGKVQAVGLVPALEAAAAAATDPLGRMRASLDLAGLG